MSSSSAGSGSGDHLPRPEIRLSPERIAALFPFHVVFDRHMRLQQVGPSMRKLLPALEVGSDITEQWGLEGPIIPFQYEQILRNVGLIFLVRAKESGLRLRGQMVPLAEEEAMVFLCSPWLPEPGQFKATGLTFDDFPVHDPMPEFLQVVQSQRFGMEDLRKLSGKLRQQRESMKETNRKLAAQSAEYQKLALIAARTDNGVVITDEQGVVEWVNEGFVRISGYTLEELRGKKPGSVLQGPETDATTVAYISRQLRSGEGFQCELLNYHKNGRKYWVAIEVQPIRDDSGHITNFMAIEGDITARKAAEFRKNLAYSVSTILAESTDTGQALERILQRIVESIGYRFSAVWRLNPEGDQLRAHTIWCVPALRNSSFEIATKSLEFVRGVGLPGVIWASNAPSWISDLTQEPNFPRRDSAERDHLRSGFASPIRVGGQACGVMEFYSGGSERPDDELLRTLTGLGNQIGEFMERQDAQNERKRLVSLLHSTLESTKDGILVTDLQRHFLTWNQRFVEIFKRDNPPAGLNHEAAVASAAEQFVNPREFLARLNWWYEHPEESGEELIHFKNGRVIERTTQPQRGPNGVIGRVWSYRDVTQRWQAEQELRESEERYRVITSTASDGIISVNRSNVILFANQAAEVIFGYPAGELVSRPLTDLMAGSYREKDSRSLMRVVRGARSSPGSKTTEVMGVRRDGTEVALEVTFGKAHVGGERVLTGVIRDITERRQAEESRRQAVKEIEAANRAKSDFLASISHEIRTPLNSIAGLTELLRETRLDADQRDMVNTVWAGSESLLHLINDLLDVSKIEAGQVDIASEKFDPVKICESAMEIVKTRAQQKGLALVCTVEPPLPQPLLGDANRIKQILVNLLSNGVKFTQEGAVTLELLSRIQGPDRAVLEFTVRDTGIGIPSHDRAKVFEKFYRVDTTVGRQAGGTGLGLSISRLLAEAMGGSLTLSSEVAQGSCFTLTLELPLAPSSPKESGAGIAGVALLLATPGRSELLCHCWRSTGVEVISFSSLALATAHLDHDRACDLVILDATRAWELPELKQFFRTLALRGKVRCIRVRPPGGGGWDEWSPLGAVESIDFPLTPSKMRLALHRVLSDTESAAVACDAGNVALDAVLPARILLVEDNADSSAYAQRVFDKARHDVTLAVTVAEAVERARQQQFDVIFMDLMLPDGSGFEATKSIRQHEQASGLPRVPVVALTAHALHGYRELSFSAEMDAYLTKPVRPDALLAAVRDWAIRRSRPLTEAGRDPVPVHIDADMADLVPDYLRRIQADLERIGELARQGKNDEIRKIGHNMRGSGTAYGFAEITRLGSVIESSAQDGNSEAAEEAAISLRAYLKNVRWDIQTD